MQAHEITVSKPGASIMTRYAGSMSDARATRQGFITAGSARKNDITIEPVEIPTGKAEFLAWINAKLSANEVSLVA